MMSALSAVLLIFSLPFSLLFLHFCQPGSTAAYWFTQYRTSEVAENLGSVFCKERTDLGNDFELILTVKMKTKHPVEGSFNSEFPAICDNCVLIVAA